MTVALFAAIGCWVAAMLFLFWRDYLQWQRVYGLLEAAYQERRDLLDRLMARDFVQFKQADLIEQHISRPEPRQDVTPEDFDLSDVGA